MSGKDSIDTQNLATLPLNSETKGDSNRAEKKTNEIRDTTETVTEQPVVVMQRGNTTFLIGLHYAEKGKETLEDKVKKLIRKDVQNEDF